MSRDDYIEEKRKALAKGKLAKKLTPSQLEDRLRSHSGKAVHRSKHAASLALNRMTSGLKDDKLEFYKCRWCKNWHIGHKPKTLKYKVKGSDL